MNKQRIVYLAVGILAGSLTTAIVFPILSAKEPTATLPGRSNFSNVAQTELVQGFPGRGQGWHGMSGEPLVTS